jgi:hypothetical protein
MRVYARVNHVALARLRKREIPEDSLQGTGRIVIFATL